MKLISQKQIVLILSLLNITACNGDPHHSNPNKIASIPEASGISYCQNTDTLVIANDEGYFYEITPQGTIITEHKLGKYDLEGVVCNKKEFLFAVENGKLLEVQRSNLKAKIYKIKGQNFKFLKESGVEGIIKVKESYYLSTQSKREKKDAYLLKVKLGANYAKIEKSINHKILDSSGLEYRDKNLYILSDKKDKLYIYDLKREKILKKIKLPKFAQEGIAFGKDNEVYLADDNGAVFKYTLKELGI